MKHTYTSDSCLYPRYKTQLLACSRRQDLVNNVL